MSLAEHFTEGSIVEKGKRVMRPVIQAGALAVILAAMGGLSANADDDIWHRDTLTGDWGGARATLHDHGVDIAPTYIGEALGNVSGGLKRGGVYEGRADLSLDADLDKLLGWTGGLFHVTGYQIQRTRGGIGGGFTGSLSDPSNIEARPATRLFTLWLQQSFLADKLSLRVGQLAADDEFLVSPTAGNLINGTFGWANIMSANLPSGGPAYPLATPGARLQVNPTPDVSILAGAFSGDPAGQGCTDDPQVCNNHGTTSASAAARSGSPRRSTGSIREITLRGFPASTSSASGIMTGTSPTSPAAPTPIAAIAASMPLPTRRFGAMPTRAASTASCAWARRRRTATWCRSMSTAASATRGSFRAATRTR
jgi:carbohydrate-selective porin OprB